MRLSSERLDIDDYEEAVEPFYQRGWTDDLPVALPTPRRVEALTDHVGRDPQESLGPVPPKRGAATVERLAINAVMGGGRPERFPVVLAAMEALLDPAHNLNGVTRTTGRGRAVGHRQVRPLPSRRVRLLHRRGRERTAGGETADDQRAKAEAALPALVAKLVEPI